MALGLHTRDLGSGLPVVGIHGLGLDHHLMTGILEPVLAARPGFRRLYVDLPGCGASPADDVASTVEMVNRVEECLDDLVSEGPLLLVGESFGGYVARELTRRLGDRVLGLALICPIALPVRSDRKLPPHEVLRTSSALLEQIEQSTPEILDSYRSVTVSQTDQTYRRFLAEVAPGIAAADWTALDRVQAEAYQLPEPPERGAPFARPTLIVVGRQDYVVGYADQWALLEHYPRATFAVLDEAGHNAHLERGDLTSALLNDWFDRLS